MASAALLKKRLHSIPLGRKTDPALRAAVTADDPTAFQAAFLAALAKQFYFPYMLPNPFA